MNENPRKVQQSSRLVAVDMLRGLIMIIMAVDHARDFTINDEAHEYWTNVDYPHLAEKYNENKSLTILLFIAR